MSEPTTSDAPEPRRAPQSTAEKMLNQRDDRKAQGEKRLENAQEYTKALNGMAATPNGELVLKTFIKALGVFVPKSGSDGVALIEINTKRNFYLEFIRPFLDTEIRQKVEE